MKLNFLGGIKDRVNYTRTLNNAVTYKSSKSDVLDFFGMGGAMRDREERDVIKIFSKAFSEDPLLTVKALFYFRDVREGMGERRTPRIIFKYMANKYPDIMRKNLWAIPEYGRWDDMYEFVGTPVWKDVIDIIRKQISEDLSSEYPSLCAKWLKSINASSEETRRLGKITCKSLGVSEKFYRKMLSQLRDKINIVENYMSENRWVEIDYEKLPSKASFKYRKAFLRNDGIRYLDFINQVKEGKKEIKTRVVYPYEIIRQILNMDCYDKEEIDILDTLWNNLYDSVGDYKGNDICVVDTSGSMYGLPIEVALSLGIYIAERNNGEYKNHFITFSGRPELQKIRGKDIYEKVLNMKDANWGLNTDLERVFDLILQVAVENKLNENEIPERLFIISDMEFDEAMGYGCNEKVLINKIQEKWDKAGYKMPVIVFWNVDAKTEQSPVKMNDSGKILISGFSPNIFKNIIKNEDINPYQFMLDILNSERYSKIEV